MKALRFLTLIGLAALVAACAGTQRAYKAADGLDETAKVVAEHYYALVREANDLADAGQLSGGDLVKAQQLVRDTRPAIDSLVSAALAFEQTQTATTEAELEAAMFAVSDALTELIAIIKGARDSAATTVPTPAFFQPIPT